jgi:hypothetical protein
MKAKSENLEAFRLLLFPMLTVDETSALWEWFCDKNNLFLPEDEASIRVNELSVCDFDYPWQIHFMEDDNSKAALIKAGSFFSETRLKEFLKLEYDHLVEVACVSELAKQESDRLFEESFEEA